MQIRVLEGENEIYQKEKLLGEGAFGKAYLVKQKQTGELLVIKEVSIDHMSQKEREETIKEAQILRNFRHPLIVKFIEVYATKQNKLKIVMEYAQSGDLSKTINARKTSKKYFEQTQILDWFTQLCLAMKHVHDRKILHRDIKGQNIFMTKANTIKLGDFGIARVLNKTQDKARTVVGTPYYLSPEIIENKPYSFKSDIWSMGVLLYQMCALTPPFTANSLQLLALKIVKGSRSQLTANYSKQLKGLVQEMLQIDPNRRPSVGDILKKPFLQQRIKKFLSQTYRKQEFSHTILHNQKVEISNQLVKIQQQKNAVNKVKDPEMERNRLKEEAALLKEKMQKKKAEEAAQLRRKAQEKLREEERVRRKREQQKRRREEDNQRKREEDYQRKREEEQKQRERQQKRAIEERKQWIEREKRRQEEKNREQEHKRVQEIALRARRRQQEEQELYARKQKLLQEKYELQREREMEDQQRKKRQNKEKESKKMEQFNDFARKQWYQNQMIRKRAEQRARQAEIEAYSEPNEYEQPFQQPKLPSRPQSNRNSRENSREKNIKEPHKKYSMPAVEPSQQQLQNVLLNPNFGKRTPQSSKSSSKQTTNVSNWNSKPKESSYKKQEKVNDSRVKKNYDQERERMKRDRQEFMKNKGLKSNQGNDLKVDETLKPAKWGKSRQKSKSRENIEHQSQQSPSQKKIKEDPSPLPPETMMLSQELRLNIKDQEEFNDYLHELEDLIGNVNKNIQNIEKPEPFPELPVVQQKIVVRQDDVEQLDYSITASFDNLQIPKEEQVNAENADFDYFSSYEKLQELRICLQDKFGTQNFIKIYRTLEEELQKKGLQDFNIIEVIKKMGDIPNSNLISQNVPLLLTLIVMQERMSSI